MVIAPGRPVDGRWVMVDNRVHILILPGRSYAHRKRALLPGWKVPLDFFLIMLDTPPPGYVLPGSVVGQTLEHSPLPF